VTNSSPLVTCKKEGLIAKNRPPKSHSELVAKKLGFVRTGAVCEKIVGSQSIISMKLIQRSVELVSTGRGGDDDFGTHSIAMFGRSVVGDHLTFGNGIDGRLDSLGLESKGTAARLRAVVGTIQEDIVLGAMHSNRDKSSLFPCPVSPSQLSCRQYSRR